MIMEENPNFFITSTEIIPTLAPRKCWIRKKVFLGKRKDISLLVFIEPHIKGTSINVPKEVIDELILVCRYREQSLSPLSEFPIQVYTCIMKEDCIAEKQIPIDSLINLFIGEIYATYNDAINAILPLLADNNELF